MYIPWYNSHPVEILCRRITTNKTNKQKNQQKQGGGGWGVKAHMLCTILSVEILCRRITATTNKTNKQKTNKSGGGGGESTSALHDFVARAQFMSTIYEVTNCAATNLHTPFLEHTHALCLCVCLSPSLSLSVCLSVCLSVSLSLSKKVKSFFKNKEIHPIRWRAETVYPLTQLLITKKALAAAEDEETRVRSFDVNGMAA